MKKILFITISALLLLVAHTTAPTIRTAAAATGDYVAIGWNELGMHCVSPSFNEMAILPPYNTLMVQLLQKGAPPRIITSGVTVEYSVINNTTVAGKTDFWQYVEPLFGVGLPQGIGLTGNGLSGVMTAVGNHFEATGIPVLPLDDSMTWNPYQRAIVNVKNASGTVIASTEVILPVSDEMNCQKCHASGGVAARGMNGTMESNVLTLHDMKEATSLMSSKPVLCANCHSDNALGAPGQPGVSSLSRAMHGKHAGLGKNTPGCYDCHPGQNTQCNRSSISGMGPAGSNPRCERCHGDLKQVSSSIDMGREPWFQEPACTKCHSAEYSTGQNLYRQSTGHGGVNCTTCHNSPHAWWPSKNPLDNVQPLALQGTAGSIGMCQVCHTDNPAGTDPHHTQ